MKAEARGKFSGVKIHLDAEECQEILQCLEGSTLTWSSTFSAKFLAKLGKKIKALLVEHPDLLEERTEEQVQAALLRDHGKIEKQLEALANGLDWKF